MRFLFTQMLIVILVCIFIAALSNLTELGATGWLIIGAAGHALFRIYKNLHKNAKSSDTMDRCPACNSKIQDISDQMQSFMFDDATKLNDD